jgi:hypothetical protein
MDSENPVSLTRSRCVMDLDPGQIQYPDDPVFVCRHEDTGDITRTVVLATADWDLMGRPERVTVSVEPGDLLNIEEDT